MRDFADLLRRLVDRRFEFVLIGGFAGVAHGASRMTRDLDLCAPFSEANLALLLEALAGLHPRFNTPQQQALPDAAKPLAQYRSLYLETDLGELDVIKEVVGVGEYEAVRAKSVELAMWGRKLQVIGLDALIDAKRALNREKDREALRELELIRQKLRGP
jgi:predicted nucleotidyltransferase